eukprot:3580618-Alexandrium_andersonii.AAC.1
MGGTPGPIGGALGPIGGAPSPVEELPSPLEEPPPSPLGELPSRHAACSGLRPASSKTLNWGVPARR